MTVIHVMDNISHYSYEFWFIGYLGYLGSSSYLHLIKGQGLDMNYASVEASLRPLM